MITMRLIICTFLFFIASFQYTFGQSIDLQLSESDSLIKDRKDPDKSENDKVIIYPVPAFFDLNVKSEKYEMVSYTMYDAHGREIKRKSLNSLLEFEISIDELASGLYFIKLYSVDNFIFSKKFIKL